MLRFARRMRDSLDYRLSAYLSRRGERRLTNASPDQYLKDFSPHQLAGVRVFSFCGNKQGYEEVLSILSFLHHVGIPESWTVVSDGSITAETQARLCNLHPCVRTALWSDFLTDQNRAYVEKYASQNVWGKKLALLTAMFTDGVSVYIDSDILFFPGADHLREILLHPQGNYFMEDYGFGMAPALLTEEEKKLMIINAGFLIQSRPIAWNEPLARLRDVFANRPDVVSVFETQHYSEQTVTHLGYHSSGAQPLPKNKYIMELEDSYHVRDRYLGPDTVLRHYFNRSRMKMWRHAKDYLR